MGRQMVKHELIPNEAARKVTFKKRKAGLLKKLDELTTLCGVIACAIIFSDYRTSPEVWPSHSQAVSVLEKFKNLPPKKQSKYMLDQESFLTRNISKLTEKLEKLKKKNERMELELIYAESIARGKVDSSKNSKDKNDSSNLLEEYLESIITKKNKSEDQ